MKTNSSRTALAATALAAAGLLATSSISADMFTPSHSCFKPMVPYQFNSDWERDNFLRDVEQYKWCISNFVDEQNRAARAHQNAAQEAIDEWNFFVDYELN